MKDARGGMTQGIPGDAGCHAYISGFVSDEAAAVMQTGPRGTP